MDILNGSSLFLLGDGQNLQISRIVTGKRASEKLPGHGAVRVKSRSPNDCFVIALHSPDGADETGLCVCPPEKIAANLVSRVSRDTLSGPVSERESQNYGVFERFSKECSVHSLYLRLNGGESGILEGRLLQFSRVQ